MNSLKPINEYKERNRRIVLFIYDCKNSLDQKRLRDAPKKANL